jgi:hypothetical protein
MNKEKFKKLSDEKKWEIVEKKYGEDAPFAILYRAMREASFSTDKQFYIEKFLTRIASDLNVDISHFEVLLFMQNVDLVVHFSHDFSPATLSVLVDYFEMMGYDTAKIMRVPYGSKVENGYQARLFKLYIPVSIWINRYFTDEDIERL